MPPVKVVFEESDRALIKELLISGQSCCEIAHKWDCDPSQLYRRLRYWKLDTKGNEVTKKKPLDEKRRRIIEYVDIRQGQTNAKEIAAATGFSWEFVKEVLIDRGIKLNPVRSDLESERKRQVLLVNFLRNEGMKAYLAKRKAGISETTYKVWSDKLGIIYKKATK